MQSRLLSFLFLAAIGLVVFQSNSAGRAAQNGQGNCGAPGDSATTCINCHNSGSINAELNVEVLDGTGASITEMVGGDTYRVRVNLAGNNANGFGFQMVALDQALNVNGEDVATWANPSDNAQIATAMNGRTYAEQNGTSPTGVFEVDWTAPAAPAENVTFYVCGNAVNGNGMNTGDGAACTTLTFPVAQTSATNDLGAEVRVDLLANPVVGATARLNVSGAESGNYTLQVFDVNGKQFIDQTVRLHGTDQIIDFAVGHLESGIYFVQLVQNGKQRTVRMVRQ